MLKPNRERPLLVSFSGVDGSGKSTQIQSLCNELAARGLSFQRLAFWDDVVVGCRYREGFVHKVYKSQPGIGEPGKPVERRDKNVRRWYLSLARHGIYFADALHLAWVVGHTRRAKIDAIIMDRYIYDELANLPLGNPLTRAYIWLVEKITPRPDIAYLLDADPIAARERKPEYPVAFMQECRLSYNSLAKMLGSMTLIPALELKEARQRVTDAFFALLLSRASGNKPMAIPAEPPARESYYDQAGS